MPRGQKICAKCNTGNGPRAFVCKECQHPFTFAVEQAVPMITKVALSPTAAVQADKSEVIAATAVAKGFTVIYTPAGDCPVRLHDLTYEGVQRWAGQVVKAGAARSKQYLPAALRYFLREFVEFNDPQYENLSDACSEVIVV